MTEVVDRGSPLAALPGGFHRHWVPLSRGPIPAVVVAHKDGDTLYCIVRAPFSPPAFHTIRLARYNARELSEPGGQEDLAALAWLAPVDAPVALRPRGLEQSHGRWVADLDVRDPQTGTVSDVAGWLRAHGYGVPG